MLIRENTVCHLNLKHFFKIGSLIFRVKFSRVSKNGKYMWKLSIAKHLDKKLLISFGDRHYLQYHKRWKWQTTKYAEIQITFYYRIQWLKGIIHGTWHMVITRKWLPTAQAGVCHRQMAYKWSLVWTWLTSQTSSQVCLHQYSFNLADMLQFPEVTDHVAQLLSKQWILSNL